MFYYTCGNPRVCNNQLKQHEESALYNRILVPLDGSKLAECVLPHVKEIASGCRIASVTLISAVDEVHLPTRGGIALSADALKQIEKTSENEAAGYLNGIKKDLEGAGLNVEICVVKGKAAEVIARYATDNNFDMIVIATHGRSGISRWVWGNVADKLLRSACVPVFMIRAPGCVPGI